MDGVQESMILQFLSFGVPQSLAAEAAGLTSQALSNRKRRAEESDEPDPFVERMRQAWAKGIIARIVKILRGDDWRAHAWYLERVLPEFFANAELRAKLDAATGPEEQAKIREITNQLRAHLGPPVEQFVGTSAADGSALPLDPPALPPAPPNEPPSEPEQDDGC